jgi:hypothetical protein
MAEVRKCPATHCPLWRYRMGKEENDELKPVREKRQKSDEISDKDISNELTSHYE